MIDLGAYGRLETRRHLWIIEPGEETLGPAIPHQIYDGNTLRTTVVVNQKIESAVVHWGLPSYRIYPQDKNASVSNHLSAVAAFFKGESQGGTLPRTTYRWFDMLGDLALRCWQTAWRVTAAKMDQKDDSEIP